jgi:hypothetical protein
MPGVELRSRRTLSYLDSPEVRECLVKYTVLHTYGLRLAVSAEPIIALLLACLFT